MATSSPVAMFAPGNAQKHPLLSNTLENCITMNELRKLTIGAQLHSQKRTKEQSVHNQLWKYTPRRIHYTRGCKQYSIFLTYQDKCHQMNHSQSFVQAGTCSPLSAPWLRVVTANRNAHAQLHISATYQVPMVRFVLVFKDKMTKWITIQQNRWTIRSASFCLWGCVKEGAPRACMLCP